MNIAIFLHFDVGWDREVAKGVARYARKRPGWQLFVWFKVPEAFDLPSNWRCDGAIAHLSPPASIVAAGTPLVFVGRRGEPEARVDVSPDDHAVGRAGAQHLHVIGFRRMSFYGGPTRWARERESSFREAVEALGAQYIPCPYQHPYVGGIDWSDDTAQLSEWLASVPGTLGLMCAHDGYARVASRACDMAGLRVPEQVAIVGVDNDLMRCELAAPPLSSIDPAAEQIGYAAAEALDEWLNERRPPSSILIPPRGLVRRRSTDVLAIEDEAVAAAVRHIRDRAAAPLGVDEVAEAACLSRSALEKRFKRHVGRSIQQEITRVRVQQACERLRDGDGRLDHIAIASGFGSLAYFHNVFKRETGRTPAGYRRWIRGAVSRRNGQ